MASRTPPVDGRTAVGGGVRSLASRHDPESGADVTVRIGWWTLDATDVASLTRFYEGLTGWARLFEEPLEVGLTPVLPPVLGTGLLVYGEHTTGPKTAKNRAHLDLAVRQDALGDLVDQVLGLSGDRTDIGQTEEAAWEVMADPEGNEFCLLPTRPLDDPGPAVTVDAVTLDADDVERVAEFWRTLLGWEEMARDEDSIRLCAPDWDAWDLLVLHTPDHHTAKNRLHPDLLADGTRGDDTRRPAEVARALDLGAARVDIGQGEAPWDVLVDPEGNEFCVLDPRGE